MSSASYRLDPTHMGLRIALLVIFFVSLISGLILSVFLVVNLAHIPSPYDVFAVFGLACLIAVGAGWVAEKILSRRWPSGRTLNISGEGVLLSERDGDSTKIGWDRRVNVMAWHFKIRKGRAWVPKGWYCVSCQLKQDEAVIVPYTFVKPRIAEAWTEWKAFPELLPRKKAEKGKQEHLLSEIGAQAQLRYAEQDRWHYGVEMKPDDFAALLVTLRERVPEWETPEQAKDESQALKE